MTREHELIRRYFAPLCSASGDFPAFGLLDDVALWPAGGVDDQLLTSDMLVADTHFFSDDPAASIARKALAVIVSDIVAKGGLPHSYLLSLALPGNVSPDWLQAFAGGLHEAQRQYGCQLIGGDTVSTKGPLVISLTLLGEVAPGQMVRRSGAAPGDNIYVSGTIGDAALGLLLRLKDKCLDGLKLSPRHRTFLRNAYLHPSPCIKLAPVLTRYASAAMDVSDGLSGDLQKLCTASNVGARVDVARVPLSGAATSALAQRPELLETVLAGGDDYRVLLTAPACRDAAVRKGAAQLVRIGEVVAARDGIVLHDADGRRINHFPCSYDHFAQGRSRRRP